MATSLTYGSGSGGVGQCNISLAASFVFTESTGSPFNYSLTNANSPLRIDLVTFTTYTNLMTSAPAGAGGVVIIPPVGNATGLTLKGVTGDTGVGIAPAAPTMILFPSTPPTNLGVVAGSPVAGGKLVWI